MGTDTSDQKPRRRGRGRAPAGGAPGGDPPPTPSRSRVSLEFDPRILDQKVIAQPLMDRIVAEAAARPVAPALIPVIIDLNLDYPLGRDAAKARVRALIQAVIQKAASSQERREAPRVNEQKTNLSEQYLFVRLEGSEIRELVRLDRAEPASGRAIYRIWPDFRIRPLTIKSISTVKADAARTSFAAMGKDIVWAVMDSGIQGDHPHFAKHGNLDVKELERALDHRDFTSDDDPAPLRDDLGHGTHVAGIIAGEMAASEQRPARAVTLFRDEDNNVRSRVMQLEAISGMAPQCKLLSLKVLDATGDGEVSNLLAAIEYIQRLNGYGRRLVVHGVNMSVGYPFDPQWFACGQSPLCVEVNRLVRAGVVVVVAAGNSGYGFDTVATSTDGAYAMQASGLDLTINDPGNADLAITVGATHRDMPHVYGVSYFSSKGPTGDGRLKPDLVAPGEKILSCAAGVMRNQAVERLRGQAEAPAGAPADGCEYVEDSGTSMAAPHVSGVIAGFLSIRREYIGQPEDVKEVFLASATDLKRERTFQGRGLVDLMRAIQSV